MDNNSLPFMLEFKGAYLTKDDIFELYKKLSNDGEIGIGNFRVLNNSLYKKKYMFKTDKGSRLATKLEVEKAVYGVFYKKESILEFYKTKYISILLDYITSGKTYETSINKNKLISTYEYMMTDEFISDLHKIKNAPEFDFYNKDVDISNCELTVDVLKEIKKELDPDYGTEYSKIAFKIAKQALKNKDYILSENQFSIISIEYSKIKKRLNSVGIEVIDVARQVKSNISRDNSYCNMIYDIANQALEKGSLSDKQEKLLIDYFEKEIKTKSLDKSSDNTGNNSIETNKSSLKRFDDLPDFNDNDFDWN
jgi:hypothetical protein